MRKLLLPGLMLLAVGAYLALAEQNPEEIANVSGSRPEPVKELGIYTYPESIIQGEPVLITVEGLGTSTVRSLTFNGRAQNLFMHDGKVSALAGVDLRGRAGTYPIVATLSDGRRLEKTFTVGAKEIVTAPLGIPEKLGGNTPAAERELVNTLVEEGRLISAIPTATLKLWEGPFRLPVETPVVTSVYGYSRQTGASTIAHKGTDFRAAVGTPIYAMNRGRVMFTEHLRNYGNTVILDHGYGLQTVYMHLSEIGVIKGDMVERGQEIGKSGETGYVIGPHLHLTVRINGISIDPMKFVELFK